MSNNSRKFDALFARNGISNASAARTIQGIDHRGTGDLIPLNTDIKGITLITRPLLNLSYDNIALSRIMTPMLTEDKTHLSRIIRATLDFHNNHRGELDAAFVDPLNPFIPLLSNTLVSISGWEDINIDTYTSQEGLLKESWSMVDDISEHYGVFDITCNFRNIQGDPITALFFYWTQYAAKVFEGSMVPHFFMNIENEIDYMTRIYRLVLDPSKRFVQKIYATGAAFPTAVPTGAAFNFSPETPFATDNDQVSIPFRCMGALYNDPILVEEFNDLVMEYNPAMGDDVRHNNMVLLSQTELQMFNNEGYPYITEENELQWWVSPERYNTLINEFKTADGLAPDDLNELSGQR